MTKQGQTVSVSQIVICMVRQQVNTNEKWMDGWRWWQEVNKGTGVKLVQVLEALPGSYAVTSVQRALPIYF